MNDAQATRHSEAGDSTGKNAGTNEGMLERAEHWAVGAAREVYEHPTGHLTEIAGAALVAGAALSITHGALADWLPSAGRGLTGALPGAGETAATGSLALDGASAFKLPGQALEEISGPMLSDNSTRTIGSWPIERRLGDLSEYRLQGLPQGQTLGDQIQGLGKLAKPVDYEKIIPPDSKVAIFGESHPVDEVRAELGRQMPQFKRMGFTHLAMEALPSTRQGLIDSYYAGKASEDELRQALTKDWGWSPGSYLYLIDTARENGIKVIAADLRAPMETGAGLSTQEMTAARDLAREKQWAKLINKPIQEDPAARVMLLGGKKHTVIDPAVDQLTTMLSRDYNLKPTVVEYTAGWQEADRRDVFDEVVSEAGMASKRFMVKLAPQVAARPADAFVHLPSLYDQ